MKDHVPDLERCKRMKEMGYPDESHFVWVLTEIRAERKPLSNEWYLITRSQSVVEEIEGYPYYKVIAAPIVTELVGEIRKITNNDLIEMSFDKDDKLGAWMICVPPQVVKQADTLPNALADLWMELKGEKG